MKMEILNLPDEIIGYIIQRMDFATLLSLLQTCRHLSRAGRNTWRGQTLLLGQKVFRTDSNYRAAFKQFVVQKLWDKSSQADVVDAGVHLVFAFFRRRLFDHPDFHRSRMERVRVILNNALNVYRDELTGLAHDAEKKERLIKLLSAIHGFLQAEILLPKTGKTFKQVLNRMLDGYGVPFYLDDQTIVETGAYLADGPIHPDDSFSSRPAIV